MGSTPELLATVDSTCVHSDRLCINDTEALEAIIGFLPRNKRAMLQEQHKAIRVDGFDDRGEKYRLKLKEDGNGIAFSGDGDWDWIRRHNEFGGEIYIRGVTDGRQGIAFLFTKS
ncbi:hypothetical protein ACLOJK_012901 [Asimina triloba]